MYFQFPNGFSQNAFCIKLCNDTSLSTFNSLTDSHNINGSLERIADAFFQFPNGFSRSCIPISISIRVIKLSIP